MKRKLFAIAALALTARAEDVNQTLAWDANPEPDIARYVVKWGTLPGIYTQTKSTVGKETSITLSLAISAPGAYYYAVVTAVNTSGLESQPSDPPLVFPAFKPGEGKVPSAPLNLRKPVNMQASLEMSKDLQAWEVKATADVPNNEPRVFFRVAIAPRK